MEFVIIAVAAAAALLVSKQKNEPPPTDNDLGYYGLSHVASSPSEIEQGTKDYPSDRLGAHHLAARYPAGYVYPTKDLLQYLWNQ